MTARSDRRTTSRGRLTRRELLAGAAGAIGAAAVAPVAVAPVVVGTAVALAAAPILLAAGQTSTSVFPVYEGFLQNDDGTLLLAFAYFNHNRTTITIPPGPAIPLSHPDSPVMIMPLRDGV